MGHFTTVSEIQQVGCRIVVPLFHVSNPGVLKSWEMHLSIKDSICHDSSLLSLRTVLCSKILLHPPTISEVWEKLTVTLEACPISYSLQPAPQPSSSYPFSAPCCLTGMEAGGKGSCWNLDISKSSFSCWCCVSSAQSVRQQSVCS